MSGQRLRAVPLVLCALLLALAAAPAAQAVEREEAARKALAALGTEKHDDPVIVFGLRETLAPRALVTQAGPSGGVVAPPAGRNAFQRARGKRIRTSGAELRRAAVVMRAGDERSWFFFEDRGPHQAFEHPGRVVLVGAETGKVRVSDPTSWVPLIDGRAPAFFRSARDHEAKRFRVLSRPFATPGAKTRAQTRQAPPSAPRQQVADALAAERSCALRVSDTLGDFFDFGGVDRTRARLGLFFEGLEALNGGFVSRRYTTRAGETPIQAAQAMIDGDGCKDLFLYAAGAGAQSADGGIVIGVRPARGGVIEWHVVTTEQLAGLVEANPGVTFKFLFDAPYTRSLNARLTALPNVVLLLASGAPGDGSFTFLPEVLGPDGIVKPSNNPDRLLEYTNAILGGLERFVNDPNEVAAWLAGRQLGGPSMMSWMMARASQISPAWMFASPLGRLKLPVMPTAPSSQPPPPPLEAPPSPINHAPTPTTPAQPTTEDTAKAFTLTANDPDGDPLTFTVTSQPGHGKLSGTPPNLVYTPDKDFNGLDSFTYEVADGRGGSGTGTVQLPVSSDNDAAITTASTGPLAQFTEDGAAQPVDPGATVTDGDSAELDGATAAIVGGRQDTDVLDATVPPGVAKDYDAATGVLTLTGPATVAAYEDMLRSVTFDSTSQAPGTSRTVELRADDGEDTGVPAEREVLVEAVNDAPALTVPGAQSASEDTAISLTPSVADADAAGDDVKVDLGVSHGTLTLATTSGLTSVTGDTTGTVSLTGSVSEVNAALAGLGYQGQPQYNGADTLSIAASDLAHNGSGGALTDSDTVAITVEAVNDAPTVSADPLTDATIREGEAAEVDTNVTVGDIDGDDIDHAQVRISAGREAGDALLFTDQNGIKGEFTAATGTLALTGAATDAKYQTALRSVRFRTTNDAPAGSRTIEFLVNDGTVDSATSTDDLIVAPVNDAPVLTQPASPGTAEDTSAALTPTVADPDAAGDDLKLDLDVDHGTLALSTTSGLTSSSGDGTGTVSVTGSLTEINAAVAGLSYLPATDFNGVDTLSGTVSDLGHNGDDGALTHTAAVAIVVSAVNDAPVNTVPGAQTAIEDATKTLSGADAPRVADVDAGASNVKVTVSALHGDITLDGTTAGSVELTGTITQVNAKLDGVKYTPGADFSGDDTITLLTSDLGHTGSGGAKTDSDTIAVAVSGDNDPPSVAVPGAQTTNEDTAKTLSPSVSDPDAGDQDVKVDLTASHGALTPSTTTGLTSHTGAGTGALSLTGSVSEVNAALTNLAYAPAANYNGADTVAVAVSDLGHNGAGGAKTDSDSVGITISPVNDAPVNQLPPAPTLDEDGSKTLGGTDKVSVNDVDAAGVNALDVKLDVDHGILTVASGSGATAAGNGTGNVHLTGTFTQVNAALDGLKYTPGANFAGGDTLTIVSDDGGANGSGGAKSDSDTLALTVTAVNDAPTLTLPAPITTDEDTAKTLSASVADLDADGADVKVDLGASKGTLTLSPSTGLTSSTGSGTGAVSLTGSVSEVNTALTELTYTPGANVNGSDSITVGVSDLGHTGSGGAKTANGAIGVTVTAVNDAPVNTVPATETTNEDTAKSLTFGVADVDADTGDLTVTLTATHGTVTLATTNGLAGLSGNGTSSAAFSGTKDEVNAALTSFTYTPDTNHNGGASVQIVTDDNGNTPAPAKTDTDSTTITVAAVNDAPVNTAPAAQTLAEDGDKTLTSGGGTNPSISDVDAAAGDDLQVSLSVGSGKLTLDATNLDFTAGDGTGDASMTFKGTKAEINGALDGLKYEPGADFAGGDTLQVVTSDLGHTGLGGARTDTDSIGLTVSAVDDAPVNTVPASAAVTEDTPKTLTFSVADVDAGNQDVKATLTAGKGRIKVASSPDLTSLTGDESKSVELVGSLTEVNAALTSFTYTPDADYAGADDALQIVTSDLGHTGTGGPLTDTDSTTLTFSSVNDAPVVTTPATASTPEDTQLTFSPAPTVSDVDAGGDDLHVTVSVSHGSLTLATIAGITEFDQGDGTGDALMTFDAPQSVVNNALNGLKYDPDENYAAGDALTITVVDEGNNGDDNVTRDASSQTAITVAAVNDIPVVDLNGDGAGTGTNPTFLETVARDNSVVLAPSTTVTDIDDLFIERATVTLTNPQDGGAESLTATGTDGVTVGDYDANTHELVLTGSAPKSEYAQVLRTVAYANTATAPDATDRAITFVVDDGDANSASATSTVEVVPLNTAPIVDLDALDASFDRSATFTEDSPAVNIAPTPNITDADPADTHLESATITLTNRPDGANESLSTNATSTSGITVDAYDAATGVLKLHGHGTVEDYETLISRVKYDNASQTPDTTDRSITVVVSDGQASSTTRTATVTVIPNNDAISNTVPGAQNGSEDIGITFSGTNGNKISVSDADAGSGIVKVTVSADHGSLSATEPSGGTRGGNGTHTLQLTGTVSAVNTALDGLGYTPDANYNGGDTITVASDDQGNSGGAARADSDTIAVTLAAVNDGPQNTVPSTTQTVNEDTNLVFSGANGNAISIDDADAGASPVKVTLGVERGALTLASTGGLSFATGDGVSDRSMVFTGDVGDVNSALLTVTYGGDANAFGADTLTLKTNDQGNTGGAAIEVTSTVAVTVAPVNDEPSFTKGANQANVANQDTSGNEVARTVNGWATTISKGPANESGQTLTFTVTTDSDALFTTLPAINASTGNLTYTPSRTASGSANVTVVLKDDGGTTNGGDDTFATQTFTITTVFPPPVARNDPAAANTADYAATGGVPIDIPQSIGVLANDDLYGATIASYGASTGNEQATIAASTPTAGGGFVTVNANGSFRYEPPATPPAGGNDTFKYRVSNPGGASTATVTIAVTNQIVFVDDDAAAGGNGSQLRPYNALSQIPSTRGGDGVLSIASGTYTRTDSATGVLLKGGEHLVGQGVSLDSNVPFTLAPRSIGGRPAAGTNPTISTNGATGVQLAGGGGVNNTIKGVTLGNAATTALLSGSSFGTLTVGSNVTINNATGQAVNFASGGTLSGGFDSVSTAAGANGISLTNISTSGTFSFGSGTIAGHSSRGVYVTGGNGSFTFGQTVSNSIGDTAGVQVKTGGTVTFSGDLNPAAAGGRVAVTSNSAATTVAFTGATKKLNGVTVSSNAGTTSFTNGGLAVTGTLRSSGGGTLNVSGAGNTISPAGASAAVSIDGGASNTTTTLNAAFSSVSSTGSSSYGILLDDAAGTFSVAGGAISSAATAGVGFTGTGTDDTVDFTYGGTVSDAAGTAISVADQDGGLKDFNGAVSTTNAGVSLSSNTGATVRFDGGLNLVGTGTTTGLSATGGGTLAVTGSTNTIQTSSGTALNVQNTTIASDGLAFRSISSSGAANGIVLRNTGSAGGLTVAGNGGTCTVADTTGCSGGTIQSSTGAGIVLDDTSATSLTRMLVRTSAMDGIDAVSTRGLTLADSVIRDNGQAYVNTNDPRADEDRGLDFLNVSGTVNILRSVVANSTDTNAHLDYTALPAANVTVTGSTFTGAANTGFHFGGSGDSTLNATVTQSTFSANQDVGFRMHSNNGDVTRQTLKFDDNNVSGGNAGAVPGRPQISINSDGGDSSTSNVKVTINNNRIRSGAGSEIILNTAANATSAATFDATVTNNLINDAQPGAADPLVDGGAGIHGWAHGDGKTRMAIRNNTVENWGVRAMELSHNDGTGTADYTVSGNTLKNPDASNNIYEGIYAFSGGLAGDTSDVCIDMDGNEMDETITAATPNGIDDLTFDRYAGAQLRFAGHYSTVVSQLQTYLRSVNAPSPDFTVSTFSFPQSANTEDSCELPQGTP